MIQALLQDQLVQLKVRNDLLQPLVLFAQCLHLRQLRPAKPAKLLAPVVIGLVRYARLKVSATLKTGDALGRSALLQALVERVKLAEAAIELRLNPKRLCEELKITSRPNAEENLTFELPAITARVRHQLRLIIPGSAPAVEPPPQLDHKLIRLVAEALEARELVLAQPARSLSAIARDAGKCRTRLGKLVCISYLAPSIIESIVQGTQPQTLTAKRLLTQPIPLDWKDQVQWAERTVINAQSK